MAELGGGISAADRSALLAPLSNVRAAADAPDASFDVLVPLVCPEPLFMFFKSELVDEVEDEDDEEKDEIPAGGITEEADGEFTSSSSAAPMAKPAASFNVSSSTISPPPLTT